MIRVIFISCLWLPFVSSALGAWTNIPSLSSNPSKSQFASYELYFSDSEYEVPYYLNHFAQVANSVVETTFTSNGVTYPRGFLNIKVNRNPNDNTPNNARIMEMQMVLAYFTLPIAPGTSTATAPTSKPVWKRCSPAGWKCKTAPRDFIRRK